MLNDIFKFITSAFMWQIQISNTGIPTLLINLYAEYIMRNAELESTSWNQDCQEIYQ